MKNSSTIEISIKGTICSLRFSYIFVAKHLCLSINAADLANILEVSGHETLRKMKFSVAMEVMRNGRREDIIFDLPNSILDSTALELRTNLHLFKKLYFMPREI